MDAAAAHWLDGLATRHGGSMARPEFLKAIRALSVRYVQQRGALPDRSPLDSAGKRAAFAGFYAPLHFLTTQAIVRALALADDSIDTLVDAGCGTGAAGAAWAREMRTPPHITAVDTNSWALAETQRTWRDLGLTGRTLRADLGEVLQRMAHSRDRRRGDRVGIVAGWSLNELPTPARRQAQAALLALAARGASVLVIEPIAARLVPWWPEWERTATRPGARADAWQFPAYLPPLLAALDRDAGFRRESLAARSVCFSRESVRTPATGS